MNSPHAFNYGFIKDLYDEAIDSGVINEVEPHTTTLMYKMGKRIYFSKGSQTNIKITKRKIWIYLKDTLCKNKNMRLKTLGEMLFYF